MKNCPFCGGNEIGPCWNTRQDGKEITMMFCNSCGATGPVVIYKTSDDENRSAKAWNKRHNLM
ncbi:Lar family restriction alleviation protein [Candidatus Aalborgicola defluviihabitans]|uniref:Lar family restriction alleviation protein n=1 Tax=Candidatus Aalborgicola defluviihabitans TaxID=3386187 RepID=UPI00390AB146|nr:Lar family restriction alleviation protein [Burkholderiales bacterium]